MKPLKITAFIVVLMYACNSVSNTEGEVYQVLKSIDVPAKESTLYVIIPLKGCTDCSDELIKKKLSEYWLNEVIIIYSSFDTKTARIKSKEFNSKYPVFFDPAELLIKRNFASPTLPTFYFFKNMEYERIY